MQAMAHLSENRLLTIGFSVLGISFSDA